MKATQLKLHNLLIRPFREEDFPAVADLGSVTDRSLMNRVYLRQMSAICGNLFLVAFIGHEPVGYIIGATELSRPSSAWALKVVVRQDHRGSGIGTRLFFSLFNRLQDRKVRELRLTVSPENKPALRLYERNGFVKETYFEGYFGKEEDRFILKKTLRSKHWKDD